MKILTPLLFLLPLLVDDAFCAWNLVWQDEFNGSQLNASEWMYEIGNGEDGWGNHELEYYTASNTRVENGHLVIDVKVELKNGYNFTSARLNSKKAWAYGKFEARARMPKGMNLWPAIWLYPQDEDIYGYWAASGEIDIVELRGEKPREIEGTIHYGGTDPYNTYSGSGEKTYLQDFSADYHTFGVEWDTEEIRWYVDSVNYHTENIDRMMWSGKGPNPYTKAGQPFDQPFYWILNVAVGGDYFGEGPYVTPEQAKQWPKKTLEVDYVRVYQWTESKGCF